ncbi:MAG: NAD(P) transhydrogenase subunit alpha [Clostridiaceae bacterium]|nr:NAD(P) transhydrogenase subunit alpha [Clostridiaceae bacterium]
MGLEHLILIVVFVVSMLVGYKIIDRVPSLLHTPLMSGMNAYSGVTVLGCLTATAVAADMSNTGSRILGFMAIVLAMINVVGGFAVTDRMLRMFHSEDNNKGGK